MKHNLYKWQQECLDQWIHNNYHGIVDVTTGAGKTYFSCAAILHLRKIYPRLRIRIVVPTIMLARQWRNTLLADAVTSIGMQNGQHKDDPDRDITIYVINSARYTISRHILSDFANGHPVLLIADECHHYGSTENSHIFDFIRYRDESADQYYSLGLSATPFSETNRSILTQSLGNVIFRYHATEATNDGIISPFAIFEIALSFCEDEWEEYEKLSLQLSILYKKLLKAYPRLKAVPDPAFFPEIKKLASMEDEEDGLAQRYLTLSIFRKKISILSKSRLQCAIELIRRLPAQQRILIFCERIEQADELKTLISDSITDRISMYHSKMTSEAKRIALDNYRMRQTDILISCRALDEGMDVPDAEVGIVLSSTNTNRQRIQRLGRILRRSSYKHMAAIYYLYIKESSDDAAYLSDSIIENTVRLTYLAGENHFINPMYETQAASVFNKISENLSKKMRTEFMHCIEEGITRYDWLSNPKDLEAKMLSCQSNHERNYWLVMKKISENTQPDIQT